MDLIVRQGEREEKVRVRRNDDGYEVTVGDRTYHVDALTARAGLRSLRIEDAQTVAQHEVFTRAQGEGVYWVSTSRGAGPVEVADPLAYLAVQTHGGQGGKRRQRVDAYMPGRVTAVLVEEGAAVTRGQGIIVLEAMKMENEIRAEHDGTVTRIHVQPGQPVDMGNPLFDLE
ncbi:MAG TPA: biotin/lipoyl-containing protein [Thermoanaerobaculia bacterium]|jgi:biotin carboxyl carrier protein